MSGYFFDLFRIWYFGCQGDFNDQPLDYWVLEVGLGGRLDAVNIVDPSIAGGTCVAIDHEAWLGKDREFIGFGAVYRKGLCTFYLCR